MKQDKILLCLNDFDDAPFFIVLPQKAVMFCDY